MTAASPIKTTENFNEAVYNKLGFAAQRLYPNEELLRFMGSWYFDLPRAERSKLKFLEVGCGSGANLWMIAREGFEAHGLDLSAQGLELCRMMLDHWQVSATLTQGSMTAMSYPDAMFDAVVDVFSGYCFDTAGFESFLNEATRVLKPGGKFFSYTPNKASDTFTSPAPSTFLDASTLDGLHRKDSPYYGQMYPFRFTEPEEYQAALEARGFKVLRNERIGRTYRDRQEYFEFTSIHAQKL
jgi:ubiquinone/menaquinone biosynthesis C-methylase UbiE